MAVENEVVDNDTIADGASNDIIADNGIDTGTNLKDGSDLDAKLDSLAGITSNVPKTTKADTQTKVPPGTAVDANGKKPGEEGYVAPNAQPRQQSNLQNGETTYHPRHYPKEFKSNAKGDVILSATGEIIASAGGGRKAFDRMLPLIREATNDAEKYKSMYDAASAANVVAANLKLAPEEYAIGARIMAAFKSDPKKAIAFLVSEAQNNGVDMSDLGVSGGGVSAAAIEKILEDKIKAALEPFSFITTDRQTQERDREDTHSANQAVSEFYGKYPDAELHEDAIAKIMNTQPGEIDIEKAYWILNAHAAKMGLDWTKPLVPQIQAKLGTTPKTLPASNRRNLPLLNGRPNNDAIVERKPTVMSGEASSTDIVKQAMREAGMVIE